METRSESLFAYRPSERHPSGGFLDIFLLHFIFSLLFLLIHSLPNVVNGPYCDVNNRWSRANAQKKAGIIPIRYLSAVVIVDPLALGPQKNIQALMPEYKYFDFH